MKKIVIILATLLLFYSCKKKYPTENLIDKNHSLMKDTIYIAGNFIIKNNSEIKNITKWNGENWNSLGKGLKGKSVYIGAMIFFNNDLYVGGNFDSAGTISSQNIAKWDGQNWNPVGSGIDGKVTSMVIYNNELYVGGWFEHAGGLKTNNIAKWNGTMWSKVGEGFSDEVNTLCIYNNELFAGGWFTKNNQGYVNANYIAKWNGTKWDTLVSSITNGPYIYNLNVYENELYAFGDFQITSSDSVNNVAKWESNIWQSVGDKKISNRIYTSCVFNDILYLAGESDSEEKNTTPYFVVWNGSTWNFDEFSFDDSPYYLYATNNYLYIGGLFTKVNGQVVNGIFQWNGTNIYNLDDGIEGNVSCIYSK